MKKEAIAVLLGYLKNQQELIGMMVEGINALDTTTEERTIHLGYLLHNLYCAFEDLFQEIAKTFENRIDDPAKYHRQLLRRMLIEVPKMRPGVLSQDSFRMLDELRGFRHIFRHSYTYRLSPEKVAVLKRSLLDSWKNIEKDLGEFESFLQEHI
jgi:uncharacterized protein YutE (UPF0331/DUF86 family)